MSLFYQYFPHKYIYLLPCNLCLVSEESKQNEVDWHVCRNFIYSMRLYLGTLMSICKQDGSFRWPPCPVIRKKTFIVLLERYQPSLSKLESTFGFWGSKVRYEIT
ncbi:hypothetical protein J1N35_041841 [Gossypium stocksii]|uniref:Uncharacterized protein n=1 Tax=Gossypium stocksii TaxID=47602 RepID=A0A9D3UGP9_9ROSI|nr:hypothetical protein J1N35_041841 [Gossypium stocksii]